MKAKIKNAKLMRVNQIWKKHKPQGLGFSDTDVIILDLKTGDSKTFNQNFYCRLKADGTLGHSITKTSEKRQQELQSFIKRYITQDKKYNIRNNINTWKGKEVEIDEISGGYAIKI